MAFNKVFNQEEIARLKDNMQKSLLTEEISEDLEMTNKTNTELENYIKIEAQALHS